MFFLMVFSEDQSLEKDGQGYVVGVGRWGIRLWFSDRCGGLAVCRQNKAWQRTRRGRLQDLLRIRPFSVSGGPFESVDWFSGRLGNQNQYDIILQEHDKNSIVKVSYVIVIRPTVELFLSHASVELRPQAFGHGRPRLSCVGRCGRGHHSPARGMGSQSIG